MLELNAHPLLISYLFRDTTSHLDLVLSAGTPCLSAFANLCSHLPLLNVISRLTIFFRLFAPPLATHPPTRPDSLTL